MHKTISTEELKKKLDGGGSDFVLVDVLKPQSYEARHVLKAVNISEGPDFVRNFEAATGVPKDREIIVYCSSNTCQASVRAGGALEEAGYTHVVHYADGLTGWQNAGFAFASAK